MRSVASRFFVFAFSSTAMSLALACSGSSSSVNVPPAHTGLSCSSASQCYAGIDAGSLSGQVTCLTQLSNGYCTHTCKTDADCCAVAGECSGLQEVCAPFESTGHSYCFLSCSTSALAAAPDAGTTSAMAYCQEWANPTFTCRSTGGGSANAQFCGP
jgi:hypothetical protein